MTQMSEPQKPESKSAEILESGAFKQQYKKRFEEAVADAQHMLIYASSKFPQDINKDTLEKLINARHRVDSQQELTTKEEAEFWLAYQGIWKLVRPVTAESIKANLPYEKTYLGKLFGNIPILSRWFGKSGISKARGTVNRHISFTVITLILLLILQIYWVIGNQLTTQATDLSQKEADLTLELSESQREYSEIEIRYKQTEIETESFSGAYYFYYTPEWERDILNNTSQRAIIEKNLELVKSQLERSSAILGVWSSPWKWLFDESVVCEEGSSPQDKNEECPDTDLPFNEEYASQFDFIDGQILAIQDQIDKDPEGVNEAENQISYLRTQASSITGQLDNWNQQYSALDSDGRVIQEKLNRIDQKNALEERSTTLIANQSEIESQIASVTTQLAGLAPDADASLKSDLDKQLSDLATLLANIQLELTDVNNQLSTFLNDASVTESRTELEEKLTRINEEKTIALDQIQYLESQMQFYEVDPQKLAEQIKADRVLAKSQWENERKILERREKADADREKKRREEFQNQLAGQFVLVILQSYVLPLLYGILGAGTSVLRTLSKQIEKVTFSDSAGIQHVLRISLGALAGIMVGWFSFLIDSSTFFGSVSPLAIAFLVGYNIELFFSLMDLALNRIKESSQQSASASENTPQPTTLDTTSESVPAQEIQIQADEEPPASQPTG